MRDNILILGAGLTGLSAAYHMKSGYTILEKNGSAGGLCGSVREGGFTFDYTGHLLHFKDPGIEALVKKLMAGNLKKTEKNSWIYLKNIRVPYPFQANFQNTGLPERVRNECLKGLIEARSNRKKKKKPSFYEWASENLGEGIVKHFIRPYNEKMWKFPIEKLTFEQMGRYFPRLKSGKWRGGYNDFFYYPVSGGIQSLCDAIPVKNLSLDTEVEKIDLKDKMVFFRKGKIRGETPFSSLISTLPLKKLVLDIVEDVPSRVRDAARKLKCSSVLNINLGIERERITDKHWIYFPEKRFIFYRAGFPMNFSENVVPRGTSSIYTEVSYRPEEKRQVLKNSKKIVRQVIEDLIEAGVLRRGDGISAEVVLEMEYAYVLCDSYYRKSVKIMKDYLEKNSIYSTGRYGAWKYSGMDDAILDGKEAAGWIEKKLRT